MNILSFLLITIALSTTLTTLGGIGIKLTEDEQSLLDAIEKNDLKKVQTISSKIDIFKNHKRTFDPLHRAIAKNNTEICKILLENVANLCFLDKEGHSVWYTAILKKNLAIMQLLLNKEPQFDTLVCDSKPLLQTIIFHTSNSSMVELLLDNGADINQQNEHHGRTALHWATIKYIHNEEEYLDIIKKLLSNNASYDINTRNNVTALTLASNNVILKDMFNEIIDYKTEIFNKKNVNALSNAITNNGTNNSAFSKYEWLTFAILNNHYKQIQYCIDNTIFHPKTILEGLALRKHMPQEFAPHLISQINNEDSATLYNLAKKHNNKKLGKMISEIYLASRILMNKKNKSSVILSEDVVRHITSYFSYTLSK